ncbi:MAG TPA: DUF6585 family protein [Pyrinomonadaceae bacterium]|nr:DUF6585 family protein [Pyrinomonadaceae bacterium]
MAGAGGSAGAGGFGAAHQRLGALREEFGRSERVRKQYAVIAAAGFILGLLFVWLGAWLPGSIFLALGVFMTWGFRRQRDLRVRVYERGFTFTRGGRTQEFAWDEIEVFSESEQVYRAAGLESGVSYQYFIRLGDGRTLRMDNEVRGVRALGERLREETSRRLLARAAEAVEGGEAANFGPLALTREGVLRGERKLPWAEVGRVDVEEGKLVVVDRAGRRWSEDLYGFVPNAHVLLVLAQRVKKAVVSSQ